MINFLTTIFIKDTYCYQQLIVNQAYAPMSLLLYSHIPTAIVSLGAGIFLFIKDKKLETKIFLFLTILFFVFTLGDLAEWFVFLGRGFVMFTRTALIEVTDPLLFVLASYFLFVMIKKRDIRFIYKIIWLLPIIVYAGIIVYSLSKNLMGYNWDICEVIESNLIASYGFYMDLGYMIVAVLFAIWSIIREKSGRRREISIISIGVCSFIVVFFTMEYILTGYILGGVFNYNYFIYAFFGMPVLIVVLGYLIIKYREFKTKLMAVQILVIGVISLIFFQYFFLDNTVSIILNTVAMIFSVVISNIIIINVKNEISQREKLEVLTTQLEIANEKLKGLDKLKSEFVSLASHQLRSPLTAIKGYTSMLIEGDYGEINPQAKETIDRIMESSNNLMLVVEDLLNVTKIEQGGMKYEMSKFDFGEVTRDTAKDLSITAEKKGLKLISNVPDNKIYFVNGDKEKLRQVLVNIIDNAMKYTKEGQIEVNLNSDNGKVILSVKDTGAGISKETIGTLFKKFSRGDGGKMNTSGSGLGLYLVKEIVEAHKGRAWVESEGLGKGSTFFVELNEEK